MLRACYSSSISGGTSIGLGVAVVWNTKPGPDAKQAKAHLGVETLTATADASYYIHQGVKDCEDAGMTPYVAIPDKNSSTRAQGRFARTHFLVRRLDKARGELHLLLTCYNFKRVMKAITVVQSSLCTNLTLSR